MPNPSTLAAVREQIDAAKHELSVLKGENSTLRTKDMAQRGIIQEQYTQILDLQSELVTLRQLPPGQRQ